LDFANKLASLKQTHHNMMSIICNNQFVVEELKMFSEANSL